jgi:hypothetical protein
MMLRITAAVGATTGGSSLRQVSPQGKEAQVNRESDFSAVNLRARSAKTTRSPRESTQEPDWLWTRRESESNEQPDWALNPGARVQVQ